MSQIKTQKAYTLIELMIVITIIAVISVLAYPSFMEMRYVMEAREVELKFIDSLRQARAYSYITKKDVLICTINEQGQCDRAADKSLMVFYDVNDNNQKDGNDELLSQNDWKIHYGRILLRVSASRGYIRYMGNTSRPRGHFGHLQYCSPSGNKRLSFKVIVNAQGNVRVERGDLVDVGC